jgi:hypothetical protein
MLNAKNATDPGQYEEKQMDLFERVEPCPHYRREKETPANGIIAEQMICLDCGETLWHLLHYPYKSRL